MKNDSFVSFIQDDTTLLLIGGIALAVLLAIVLVVVISAMRIKVYKERFKNLLFETKDKVKYIRELEKELEIYKIKDAKNEQELVHFDETKTTLNTTKEEFSSLQKSFNETDKELSQIKAKLESSIEAYEKVVAEFAASRERFDEMQEENNKFRTTNARLLMKLENEERFMKTLKEKQE